VKGYVLYSKLAHIKNGKENGYMTLNREWNKKLENKLKILDHEK
jgi:hypothetical protein